MEDRRETLCRAPPPWRSIDLPGGVSVSSQLRTAAGKNPPPAAPGLATAEFADVIR